MQTIDKFNFAGKKAFVRVDFNVPLDENFNITDDTRMRAALPTLKKILADGGSIIIGSHLGRPKGVADKFSLKHIIKHLSELLGVEVQFANDCMGEEAAVKAAAEYVGPVYLRFGRLAVPVINDNPEYKFEIGKGVELRKGKDITIFATGLCVSETLKAAETLAADGIDAQVINIHTIKPLDEELVLKAAKQTGRVYTVEEHSIIGGLGSAVAELLGEKCPTKITRIGVKDVFGESGPAKELLHKYELDAEGIAKRIMEEQKSC